MGDADLQYLFGYLYLITNVELSAYYTFCIESSNPKLQSELNHMK
jgi:hypothetical protein